MQPKLISFLLCISFLFTSKSSISQTDSKLSLTGIDQIQLGATIASIKTLFEPAPIMHYYSRIDFENQRKEGIDTKPYERMTEKRTYRLSKKNSSYFKFCDLPVTEIEVTVDDNKKVMEILLFFDKSETTFNSLITSATKQFGEVVCKKGEMENGTKTNECLWEKNSTRFLIYDFDPQGESTHSKHCWVKFTNSQY